MKTFMDVQNNLHTLALTTQNAYMVTPGPVYNLLGYPGSIANLGGTSLPYGYAVTNNRVYFSNGSVEILYSDGEANLKSANAPGSARFLSLNAAHLIAAYTTEPAPGVVGSTVFPQRVRWAKSGDPNDWSSFTSGLSDLLDIPDVITGLATMGRNTGVFRTNGITAMIPTGVGANPFNFENVTQSSLGIGNYYPYSLAVYNDMACFVAQNDIYICDSGFGIKAIGGKAKKQIMQQLAASSGDVVMGFPVAQLGPGIDYLSYWLVIPPGNVWIYQFDEDNWQQFNSSVGRPTFIGSAVVG
jgi:hypothetical protein